MFFPLLFATCLLKYVSDHSSLYAYFSSPCLLLQLIGAGMFLESAHFDCIIKFLHQLKVSSQELNTVLNIKPRYVFKELLYICLVPSLGSIFINSCMPLKGN